MRSEQYIVARERSNLCGQTPPPLGTQRFE